MIPQTLVIRQQCASLGPQIFGPNILNGALLYRNRPRRKDELIHPMSSCRSLGSCSTRFAKLHATLPQLFTWLRSNGAERSPSSSVFTIFFFRNDAINIQQSAGMRRSSSHAPSPVVTSCGDVDLRRLRPRPAHAASKSTLRERPDLRVDSSFFFFFLPVLVVAKEIA